MCGEHTASFKRLTVRMGSSPHVRGACLSLAVSPRQRGIIPACAGSMRSWASRSAPARDHPRMCGEHKEGVDRKGGEVGSSPHVRGALAEVADRTGERGIIPACAGSIRAGFVWFLDSRDHPRMCGEHQSVDVWEYCPQGSSPHVRGAFGKRDVLRLKRGIIPACAGSILSRCTCACPGRDHPRMCGEHPLTSPLTETAGGSSPHVRGASASMIVAAWSTGIIPACAGSMVLAALYAVLVGDHPRMCGEHILVGIIPLPFLGSSPHVRGALGAARSLRITGGIIPACAGSMRVVACGRVSVWDHPRMCGEHGHVYLAAPGARGSSPHVRGASADGRGVAFEGGIIPACAGSIRRERRGCPGSWDHPRMCGEHPQRGTTGSEL